MGHNIDFESVRSLDRWNLSEFLYEGIDDFNNSNVYKKGIHSISIAGLKIDICIDLKKGKPLVFCLNGAMPRNNDLKLPVFSGLSILPSVDVSRVYINDPTLYVNEKLSLGWYAGSKFLDLQSILPKVMKRVVEVSSASKIIFIGGSGGGFASLYYGTFFPESLVVPWNPQTNILKYIKTHVNNYAKYAFDIINADEVDASLSEKIDVDIGDLKNINKNYILYLQNKSDWHVKDHLIPFLSKTGVSSDGDEILFSGQKNNRLYLQMGDWGDGHIQPPKTYLSKLFKGLISYDGEWSRLFSDESMSSFLNELGLN